MTASEFRRVDQAYQGDLALAMDRAGHAVALAAARAGAGYGREVAVLAGPGNNGGDGYVAARYLKQRGAHVTVHALAEPASPLTREMAGEASRVGVVARDLAAPVDADVVIDAVFGGGSRQGMPEEVTAWMDTTAPVVAVDYPTGLDPDSGKVGGRAFVATETVTFSSLKTGHVLGAGPDHCGIVTVADIGIEGGAPSLLVAEEMDAPRPKRTRRAHKWKVGAVLVVGGSGGLAGAAVYAGRAALEFGAGSVYVAAPDPLLVQTLAPDLPVISLNEASETGSRFDVVVAGPGLAPDDEEHAHSILGSADRVLLDAGCLTRASLEAARTGEGDVVVTPHDGEFARVAGVGPGTFAVRSFAEKAGVTVLRKGNPTMVSDGGLPVLVRTGGPELASIGTGDVLAGMIGALWARGLEARTASISGAYWHGVAGRSMSGHGTVTASKLVDHIGRFAW